jgi:outer membrane lipoprotein-sorting protein
MIRTENSTANMKQSRITALTASVLVGLVAAAAARAQAPATPEEVIHFVTAKTAAYRTVSSEFSQTIHMLGAPMAITGKLHVKQPGLLRMQMNLPMFGQQGALLMLMDANQIMWQEMDLLGQRQIMKADMARAWAAAAGEDRKQADFAELMDPARQWKQVLQVMNLNLLPQTELRGQPMYVLEGRPKPDAAGKPHAPGMAGSFGRVVYHFGKQDGYLHKFEQFDLTGANAVLTMELLNPVFNAALSDELFRYTPPEDARVMDITEMIRSQLEGGGSWQMGLPGAGAPPAAPAP